MGDTIVVFDPQGVPGLKFPSPSVRDEIAELAPIFIEAESVTESKLADGAVSNRALDNGAVNSPKIATEGVATINLADECVTSAKLEFGSITSDKVGAGVVTAINSAGDPIMMTLAFLTALEYAAIAIPDPNTLYVIS